MAHRRFELTDFEWSIIEALLPDKPRGVQRVGDRKVLNGIHWRLGAGSPWADIPERYGPRTTCYNRFVRGAGLGVWDRIFDAISEAYKGSERSVDRSSIRVHQHGANAKKGVQRPPARPVWLTFAPAAWGGRGAARPPRSMPSPTRAACRSR